MIVVLPKYERKEARIRVMIGLAKIFEKIGTEIAFSDEIAENALIFISGDEEDASKTARQKVAEIEKTLEGLPATIMIGRKSIRLNRKNNKSEGGKNASAGRISRKCKQQRRRSYPAPEEILWR